MADRGKRINVTRREFQDSYRSHYKHYKNSSEGSDKSRRLILFYAVECGLKGLIMKSIGKNTYEELELYCSNNCKKELAGHNIKAMLKEVNPRNEFVLKNITLKSGSSVQPAKFNELWRYGAAIENTEEEEKAEKTLAKIAEWIYTRL